MLKILLWTHTMHSLIMNMAFKERTMNVIKRADELIDKYATSGDIVALAWMVAMAEHELEKREEYVEFLVKELGEAQFELMMAQNN